jgi:transposase InsO family protein
MVVLAHIKEQSRLSLGSYGRPRMTEELKEVGIDVGHRRVGRLMRENGIVVERTRKFKATTDSDHTFNIAPNLLDRDFMADRPNQKWAGDISYIWTREGWLYLAVILDLHSRRVIGWAVSNRMKRDLAIRALKMAIALRSPPFGCIFHSDRGSQYCSHDYQKVLREHGLQASMSGKGNCYDNAAVETFFKTIKAELIWRRSWETRRQAETAIFQYINGFYNPRRRHSALGGKKPLGLRTPSSLNEHLERHKYVTGPLSVKLVPRAVDKDNSVKADISIYKGLSPSEDRDVVTRNGRNLPSFIGVLCAKRSAFWQPRLLFPLASQQLLRPQQ